MSEFEDVQKYINDHEKEVVLAAERIRAKEGTPEDLRSLARFNTVVAPYYAALISRTTEDPHLEPEEVLSIMSALSPTELQIFLSDATRWFAPPDIEDLKKKESSEK